MPEDDLANTAALVAKAPKQAQGEATKTLKKALDSLTCMDYSVRVLSEEDGKTTIPAMILYAFSPMRNSLKFQHTNFKTLEVE